MNKAVFLDRDGVINKDFGYVYKKENFILIAGVGEALQYLVSLNYQLIIVTNQSGIGRGYYTENDFQKLNEYMKSKLISFNIDLKDIFYCPHHPEAKIKKYRKACDCRKPAKGMIEKGIFKYKLDRSKCFLIGDRESDMEAAKLAGIRGLMFKSNNLNSFIRENIKY